jgi:hypothetical protein
MVGFVFDGHITFIVAEHNIFTGYAHLKSRVDQDGGVYTANGSTDLKPRGAARIATPQDFKPVQIMQTLW